MKILLLRLNWALVVMMLCAGLGLALTNCGSPPPSTSGSTTGGTTTTATNGRVLSDILSTISRERCRYVGVVATDTRDKLFLIRLIREYCPDVRIFLTGGDLLFSHPDYRFHCRGVIVGSSRPEPVAANR